MQEVLQKDEVIIREIVNGARVLFEKYGLKKTTMEDIAKEVGKGKSSLYYYFPSKYEIFEAVVSKEIIEFYHLVRDAIENASSARDKLKAYSRMRICKIRKMGSLSAIIRDDLLDNIGVLINIRKKHEKAQIAMVGEIISDGVRAGEFRSMPDEDILKIAALIIASFRGIELPFCSESVPDELFQSADLIVDILVEGIGNKWDKANLNRM